MTPSDEQTFSQWDGGGLEVWVSREGLVESVGAYCQRFGVISVGLFIEIQTLFR